MDVDICDDDLKATFMTLNKQDEFIETIYKKQRSLDRALLQINLLEREIEDTKKRYDLTETLSLELRLCTTRGVKKMFYVYVEKLTTDLERLTDDLLMMMEVE